MVLTFVRMGHVAFIGAAIAMAALAQKTVVGIRGSVFTINGQPTYTAQAGFPNADPNLIGTLLNVRACGAGGLR